MTRPFTRFEKFLAAGMLATGIGLAASFLVQMDRERSAPLLEKPNPPVGRQPIEEWENGFPDGIGWWRFFVWCEIDGRTKDGETVRGHVEGVEENGNGIKVLDERTNQIRYYRKDGLAAWVLREYPHPYPQDYDFRVRRPTGIEQILHGKLICVREDSFVIHLESGMVEIARGDMASIKPVQLAKHE